MTSSGQWFTCPICGAYHFGGPPHGADQPCPQKLKIDWAYLNVLEAQKASYTGQALSVGDMAEAVGKLLDQRE